MSASRRLGILVGGGPAPGINGVISSATIEAINEGLEVVGIRDGFKHLVRSDVSKIRPARHRRRLARPPDGRIDARHVAENPTKSAEALQAVIDTLKEAGVTHLVTIGGDDTALSGSQVAQAAPGAIRVAHVPKTIDNDLPLPAARADVRLRDRPPRRRRARPQPDRGRPDDQRAGTSSSAWAGPPATWRWASARRRPPR